MKCFRFIVNVVIIVTIPFWFIPYFCLGVMFEGMCWIWKNFKESPEGKGEKFLWE